MNKSPSTSAKIRDRELKDLIRYCHGQGEGVVYAQCTAGNKSVEASGTL